MFLYRTYIRENTIFFSFYVIIIILINVITRKKPYDIKSYSSEQEKKCRHWYTDSREPWVFRRYMEISYTKFTRLNFKIEKTLTWRDDNDMIWVVCSSPIFSGTCRGHYRVIDWSLTAKFEMLKCIFYRFALIRIKKVQIQLHLKSFIRLNQYI